MRHPQPLCDRQRISSALQTHHLFEQLAGPRARIDDLADHLHGHWATVKPSHGPRRDYDVKEFRVLASKGAVFVAQPMLPRVVLRQMLELRRHQCNAI